MIKIWITLSVIIMLLLFWRQVFVFKMPLKINYAPLVLVIGFISSISIFMYITHQLKLHELRAKKDVKEQLLSTIIEDISDYFIFIGERLTNIENADEKILHTVQKIVENELSEFAQISKNSRRDI